MYLWYICPHNTYSMTLEQHIYRIDVLAKSAKVRSKVRLVTVSNQFLPAGLLISCLYQERRKFNIGSIFKVDFCLVTEANRKPFLCIIESQPISQYKLFNNSHTFSTSFH